MLCAAFFYSHGTRENLPKRLLYKKGTLKTLVKLTPGLNFINFRHTAFALVDPERAKKTQSSQHCYFTLLGSASVKVVRRTLMKLTPGEHDGRRVYAVPGHRHMGSDSSRRDR